MAAISTPNPTTTPATKNTCKGYSLEFKKNNNSCASPSTSTDITSTTSNTTTTAAVPLPPQNLKSPETKNASTPTSPKQPSVPPQQQLQIYEHKLIEVEPPSMTTIVIPTVKNEIPSEPLKMHTTRFVEASENHLSTSNNVSHILKEDYTNVVNNNYNRPNFIKSDCLSNPEKLIKIEKIEKTREDVARTLSFTNDNEKINKSSLVLALPSSPPTNITTHPDTKTVIPPAFQSKIISTIITNNTSDIISSKKIESRTNSSSSSYNSNSHRNGEHKTSTFSSSHRSSRERSSSTSCSKCYRRSKIKKSSIGIQCKRQKCIDETNPQNNISRSLASSSSYNKLSLKHQAVASSSVLHFENLKYEKFFHLEVHSNGGASVIHMYQDELDVLSKLELDELVDEFFKICFHEDENGYAYHVMGIVHDAARYLPDLLEHMAENYANLTVKSGVLGRNSDIETCTMQQYNEQVVKNYAQGTFRYGPLHQISLVGKVHEEVGGYFPDLLGRLEANPFLHKVC